MSRVPVPDSSQGRKAQGPSPKTKPKAQSLEPRTAPLRREQRDRADRRWTRSRSEERVDVGQVLRRQHFLRIRRHVAGRLSGVLREARERHRIRTELRPVRSTLPFVHVTLKAPDLAIDRGAGIDSSGRSLRCRRARLRGRRGGGPVWRRRLRVSACRSDREGEQ